MRVIEKKNKNTEVALQGIEFNDFTPLRYLVRDLVTNHFLPSL